MIEPPTSGFFPACGSQLRLTFDMANYIDRLPFSSRKDGLKTCTAQIHGI